MQCLSSPQKCGTQSFWWKLGYIDLSKLDYNIYQLKKHFQSYEPVAWNGM